MVIVNIGYKHTGKTTRAIAKLMEFHKRFGMTIIVNDVQNEEKYRTNKAIKKFKGTFDGYRKVIKYYDQQAAKVCVIAEECGFWFNHSVPDHVVVSATGSARFNGNVYMFNFHALGQVPDWLLNNVDYVWIGYCKGRLDRLSKKYGDYPEILEAWERAVESYNSCKCPGSKCKCGKKYYFEKIKI